MAKVRTVIYLGMDLFQQVNRLALRLAVSRSAVISAAVTAGLPEVERTSTLRRHGQGARPVASFLNQAGSGYTGQRRAPVSAAQRTLARVGQIILRVTPAIQPDEFRDALVAEAPVHLPGVDIGSLDIDAIVDALYESHDGDLVRVPGDEPPEDPAD